MQQRVDVSNLGVKEFLVSKQVLFTTVSQRYHQSEQTTKAAVRTKKQK